MSGQGAAPLGHTPGPWTWREREDGPRWSKYGGGFEALEGGNGERIIAGSWRNDSDADQWVKSEADAYLIAAAPELLEALDRIQIVVTEKDDTDWRWGGETDAAEEILGLARAAIAKARGEQ